MARGREIIFHYLTKESDGTWHEMVVVDIDGERIPAAECHHEEVPDSYREFFILREDLCRGDNILVFEEPGDSRF